MPQIYNIKELTQTESSVITTVNGTPVSLDGALTYSAQCVVDVDTPTAKTFDSGAANVSDSTVVADVGVKEIADITCVADVGVCEVSDVTCVADVAGSLNSTYFNYQTRATGGATTVNRYAWFNVNGAGVDPAPVGRTGIAVVLATDAADTAVATALRAALAADTNVTITGGTTHCIITNRYMGTAVDADNGVASPGFSFSITAGVASNLLSKYFNYETKNLAGATVNLRYVWFNVNGEGVDPAPASRTGIAVALVASAADTLVASSTRTALGADNKVAITGGTTHVIITNVNMGNVTNADNGAASPGFSYSITAGVASNLNNSYMTFSSTVNAVNYYAWFNINSEGTDPALAGKTAIVVLGAASISANDLATAARAAIDLAIGPTIVISGSTNHVILTNSTRGTCTATANGAVSPGFTISNSPAGAAVEVSIDPDNYVTIPTHGLTTGLKGQLTTTGTLPAGVTTGVDYFIIALTANTVQFASSLALAQAGTAIVLTDTGTDNAVNTFTSTSIAGATVKLQKSNDGLGSAPTNWTDEGSATNITADANLWLEKVNPSGNWMRLVYTITAGRFSTASTVIVKGPS